MKRTLAYGFLVMAFALTACQPAPAEAPTAPAEGPAAPTTSERCGDASQLADELLFYNWTEYIDPALKDQFAAECGVEVVETNFESNEELLAQLQAGGGGYDVIVPSDYMVSIMIGEGMLMPIDFDIVTNIQHMDPMNVKTYFDPEQKYSVPYTWGTSGFAVDTNVVTEFEHSWSTLFDPNSPYCGQISMLDDERETIGAALMYLGYGINDVDPLHLEEAKTLLIEQSGCVKAYDSDTNDDLIVSGETVLGHMWTGDAVLAGQPDSGGREGIEYIIPHEGCTIWQDNLAVPVGAPNPYTAMVFINYMSDPETAAQNIEYIGYGTPNAAAKEFIDPEVLANEGIYPPPEVAERLQWIEDVGDALELYDRIWTEFKAAAGS